MKNIWQKLKKPILALAPMDAVTDTVFRQIVAKTGAPDVFFTEFTNVEGLMSKGRKHIIHRLQFIKKEKPIIAQVWGTKPENFYKTARLIEEMGFDGIDINMGCPVRDIVSHGSCSALINNPSLAKEIIQATQEGCGNLPVSVKTRIGFKVIQMDWIEFLLQQNLDVLTVHLRTVKEMSDFPAHWEEAEKIVALRNRINPKTLILGNGDVQSISEAKQKVLEYGIDGVMIGRGIFHNIWLFNNHINPQEVSVRDRLKLLREHTDLFYKTWGNTKDFNTLKKFYKIYVSGFDGASDLRVKLMETKKPEEVHSIIQTYLKNE